MAPGPTRAGERIEPVTTLFNVWTHEALPLLPGEPVEDRFHVFLRDHFTNQPTHMDPRLVGVLASVANRFSAKRIEIVSGYRNPTVAKNPRSPHMKGLACDFRVDGVKAAELRDYLRKTFEKVGVGYYPNSTFVHVDVRKERSAFWIDYSGPGERAVYSENPNEDLRSGRADTYKPTKIDESWASDESSIAAETGGNAATQKSEPQAGEAPKDAPK